MERESGSHQGVAAPPWRLSADTTDPGHPVLVASLQLAAPAVFECRFEGVLTRSHGRWLLRWSVGRPTSVEVYGRSLPSPEEILSTLEELRPLLAQGIVVAAGPPRHFRRGTAGRTEAPPRRGHR